MLRRKLAVTRLFLNMIIFRRVAQFEIPRVTVVCQYPKNGGCDKHAGGNGRKERDTSRRVVL